MRKIKTIVAIIIFLGIAILSSQAQAASFKFITLTSKTVIAPGEETVITLKVSDIDMGNNGVKTLSAYLEYDEKKFEEVKSIKGIGTSQWSWQYNVENRKFTGVVLEDGAKTATAIGTITLKAKTDATEGTTTVKIKNIESSDGLTDVASNDSSVDITIKKKAEGESNKNNTKENTRNTNNGTTNQEHPYAGKSEDIGIIVTLIILSIVGYKMYTKYQGKI